MLSNSSKYAINAVLYLAINASASHKLSPKQISEALNIPSPFLAKILQTLARNNAITSVKGPNGGFFLTDEEKEKPLISIIHFIDGVDKFTSCSLSLKACSKEKPCPMHSALEQYRTAFLKEMEENPISFFAEKVKRGEAFLTTD